jgi:hypothetical protein
VALTWRLLRAIVIAAVLLWAAAPAWAQSIGPAAPESARPALTVTAVPGLEGLAARVAERAPETLARIADDLRGLPVPTQVEIRLVRTSADIPDAAPPGRGAPSWAAGVAYADAGVVVVATRREHEPIDVMSTVDHELAHMALDAALGDRAPRWLHEGFAYLHSSEFSMERTSTLTGMAWFGRVIPLPEIDQRFPAQENAAGRAYAQSYDFVAFLAHRGRYLDPADDGDRWAFRDFLREIGEGKSVHRAAVEIYGATLDELFEEWYQNLRERYLIVPASLFALSVWIFGAILLVLAWMRRRRQKRRRLAQMEIEEAGSPEPSFAGFDQRPVE